MIALDFHIDYTVAEELIKHTIFVGETSEKS